ncbi:MAG: hypothetical protein HIU89_05790 [Proteobacteria bacterium]|nr:hypothetical protein [Pseudomonadota bacterium]
MRRAIFSAGVLTLLAGCGGGSSSTSTLTSLNPYNPSNPDANAVACVPGTDVIGAWKTVANNNTVMPDSPNLNFFSYNQPSINSYGLVVFRGRAKSATTGSGGQPQRGVYTVDVCPAKPAVYTVADTANTLVPQPNNTGAMFNEFPSIPRIDMSSGVLATRGQNEPQWTYTDPTTLLETKVGTAGLYVTLPDGLTTGMNILGAVPEFSSAMRVPNTVSTTPVKFDQFPGSPSVTGGKYLITKGNYTDTEPATGASGPARVGKTGVYFRDLSSGTSPVQVIADSNTVIPGTPGVKFGSTAPPSAANGHVVFTGLDNEDSPTAGGIYVAPIANLPTLTPLVQIGQTPVPDSSGKPLPAPSAPAPTASAPTFTQVGEGLAFDGRYVAFWGAWGTDPKVANGADPGMHGVTLNCPTDGDKDIQAACKGQYPSGQTTKYVPSNQGIFIADTMQPGKIWMVADAEKGSVTHTQFADFLYWVFSGAPSSTGSSGSGSGAPSSAASGSAGGSGSSGPTDAEPPRWRASAFAAVDGKLGVIFKGSLNPGFFAPTPAASAPASSASSSTSTTAGPTPASGIYGANFKAGTGVGPVFKVIALGDDMSILDPAAPAGSYVSSVGIEREALRGGWLTLTASSLNALSEGWAGIYATDFPGTAFKTDQATPMANLILGQ